MHPVFQICDLSTEEEEEDIALSLYFITYFADKSQFILLVHASLNPCWLILHNVSLMVSILTLIVQQYFPYGCFGLLFSLSTYFWLSLLQ